MDLAAMCMYVWSRLAKRDVFVSITNDELCTRRWLTSRCPPPLNCSRRKRFRFRVRLHAKLQCRHRLVYARHETCWQQARAIGLESRHEAL